MYKSHADVQWVANFTRRHLLSMSSRPGEVIALTNQVSSSQARTRKAMARGARVPLNLRLKKIPNLKELEACGPSPVCVSTQRQVDHAYRKTT